MFGNDKNINNDGHVFKDCFQANGAFRKDWEVLRQPIRGEKEVTLNFYQHGNLSILRDVKSSVVKIKSNKPLGLLEMITNEWADEKIPLFVAEGTDTKKLECIDGSSYLSTVFYEVLPNLIAENSNLVIYGWKLGEQELHIVHQLFKSKTKGKVAISTFEKDQDECHRIVRLIKVIAPEIEVEFFDSQSSGCWNNR